MHVEHLLGQALRRATLLVNCCSGSLAAVLAHGLNCGFDGVLIQSFAVVLELAELLRQLRLA